MSEYYQDPEDPTRGLNLKLKLSETRNPDMHPLGEDFVPSTPFTLMGRPQRLQMANNRPPLIGKAKPLTTTDFADVVEKLRGIDARLASIEKAITAQTTSPVSAPSTLGATKERAHPVVWIPRSFCKFDAAMRLRNELFNYIQKFNPALEDRASVRMQDGDFQLCFVLYEKGLMQVFDLEPHNFIAKIFTIMVAEKGSNLSSRPIPSTPNHAMIFYEVVEGGLMDKFDMGELENIFKIFAEE